FRNAPFDGSPRGDGDGEARRAAGAWGAGGYAGIGLPDSGFVLRPLLQIDLRARLGELLLDLLGLGLGDPFLHGLRGAVDEILGLLQAEAGHLTDDLDDVDLLVTHVAQDHV